MIADIDRVVPVACLWKFDGTLRRYYYYPGDYCGPRALQHGDNRIGCGHMIFSSRSLYEDREAS